MHQGSWLQGVIWPLTAQMADGQATEFLVNDGNEFAGGFLIAVCELSQQRGYVGRDGLHTVPPPQALRARPRRWWVRFYSHLCWMKVISQFFVRLCGFSAEIARYQVGGECPGIDPSSQIQTYAHLHESPPLSFVAASSFDHYKEQHHEEQILAFPLCV